MNLFIRLFQGAQLAVSRLILRFFVAPKKHNNPSEGQIGFEDGTLSVYNGTAWEEVEKVLSGSTTTVDELEHDADPTRESRLISLDSSHFVLFGYSGINSYLKTFSVNDSFEITQIDEFAITAMSIYPGVSVEKIDDTHFMLGYGTAEVSFVPFFHIVYKEFVKTFSVDGSYVITEDDSLEFGSSEWSCLSLLKLSSTHYIFLSEKNLYIFSIDGSFILTQVSSVAVPTTINRGSLVLINSTHFLLATQISSGETTISTYSIDGSYAMTEIDNIYVDSGTGTISSYAMSLVAIDSTHFALAYTEYLSTVYSGHIKTYSIDGSYNLTEIDDLEHDAVEGLNSSLVLVDSTHLMLAYTGDDDDGFVKVFSFDASADNITQISSREYDDYVGEWPSLIEIESGYYMLAYSGTSEVGILKTLLIE